MARLLREALFPISGARKSDVRASSVRKIIDFCEEDNYGRWTRAAVYWYFELLILKDPESEHLSKSLRVGNKSAGAGTLFRTLIL